MKDKVAFKKVLSALAIMMMIALISTASVYAQKEDLAETASDIGVSYRGHVENYGNMPKPEGTMIEGPNAIGTRGQGLRVEGFWIELTGDVPEGASINYSVHVQNVGWMESESNGDFAGTTGNGYRVESIKIWLEGLDGYDVYYRGHVQNVGNIPMENGEWGWVKNGTELGTTGSSLRLEELQVKIVKQNTDLSEYKDLIAAVDELDQSAYSSDSWQELQTVISDNIMTEDNTQIEVDAAVKEINKAYDELVKYDETVYDVAGTYGPSSGTQTIDGNVIVKADGVTLQNLVINGNLIIDEAVGDGDVTLNNITVMDNTYIRGGGENSIHINGGDYKNPIIIEKTESGGIRVVTYDDSNTKIVIGEGNQAEEVILEGDFSSVEITTPDVVVQTKNGSIGQMTLDENATGCEIRMDGSSVIGTAVFNAGADVKGQGTIQKSEVYADGVTYQKAPGSQTLGEGVTEPEVVGDESGDDSGGSDGTNTGGGGYVTPIVKSSAKAIVLSNYGYLDYNMNVIDVPVGTTVSELLLGLTVSDKATAVVTTVFNDNTVVSDLTTLVNRNMGIQVTAENGSKANYMICMVKSTQPTTDTAFVSKVSDAQASVQYTLTSNHENGSWWVYNNIGLTDLSTDVSASFNNGVLTLTSQSDNIAVGTYYIIWDDGTGCNYSESLALSVGSNLAPGSTVAAASNMTLVLRDSNDIFMNFEKPLDLSGITGFNTYFSADNGSTWEYGSYVSANDADLQFPLSTLATNADSSKIYDHVKIISSAEDGYTNGETIETCDLHITKTTDPIAVTAEFDAQGQIVVTVPESSQFGPIYYSEIFNGSSVSCIISTDRAYPGNWLDDTHYVISDSDVITNAQSISVCQVSNGTIVNGTSAVMTATPYSDTVAITPYGSQASSEKEITATNYGTLDTGNIINVPSGTKVSELKDGLTVSDYATKEILDSAGGSVVADPENTDVTEDMVILVTAQDASTAEYTITMETTPTDLLTALSSAKDYQYTGDSSYTYSGSFDVTGNSITMTYATADDMGTSKINVMNDMARYLGALYWFDSGVSVKFVKYNGETYTWDPENSGTEPTGLKGSNWYSGTATLVSKIVADFQAGSISNQITITILDENNTEQAAVLSFGIAANNAGAEITTAATVSGAPTSNTIIVNAAVITDNPGSQNIEYAISSSNSDAPSTGWQQETTFSGLSANTGYYIWARSAATTGYDAGTALASDLISTATLSSLATPVNLQATPGDQSIALTWDDVSNATGYCIYQSTDGSNYSQIASDVTTNSYTATGLTAGNTYFFKVLAQAADFSDSDYSAAVSAIANVDLEGASYVGNSLLIVNASTDSESTESSGTLPEISTMETTATDDQGLHRLNPEITYQPSEDDHLITEYEMATTQAVNDTATFSVLNYSTSGYDSLDAICKYVGTNVEIWVDNTGLGASVPAQAALTQAQIDAIGAEFDNNIYGTMTNDFGTSMAGKVTILLYDIQDGFTGDSGAYAGGYYASKDMYTKAQVAASNERNMLYVDTWPSMGVDYNDKDVTQCYSTMAHEYQHAINFYQNVVEDNGSPMDSWLNEALSQAAEELIYGTQSDRITEYKTSTAIQDGRSLLDWQSADSLPNYAMSYMFGQYLRTQSSDAIFKDIIDASGDTQTALITAIHSDINENLTMSDIFTNFRIATVLNADSGVYGFNGEADYDGVTQLTNSTSGTCDLSGGGALLRSISEAFSAPTDQGANIRYVGLFKNQ